MTKQLGKIDQAAAEKIIFQNCGFRRKEVSTGPAFGVDVSLVDLPGGLALASTSDPLSLVPSLGLRESAWLSVHLMANDMATTGFAPMYGQLVLNLPSGFSTKDFNTYWNFIHLFCEEIGVAITGGHTGFTEGQDSTIAGGGTFFTVAKKDEILTSKKAKPSDVILVTKKCALSSSAILCKSFPETVLNNLGQDIYDRGCSSFYQTSSLQDALVAAGVEVKHPEVTAMHDVTEGGVLGAIYELVTASGNGAIIDNEKLPMGKVQQEICQLFSIDARFSIGAGSMIITCEKGKEELVIQRLQQKGIACCAVGEVVEKEKGIKIKEGAGLNDLIYPDEDPYWGAFFEAFNMGLR